VSNKKRQQFFHPTDASQLPSALMAPANRTPVKPEPNLKAQTPNQKGYIRKLTQQHHDILLTIGPAGTGKTYVAVLYAIKQFRAGEIDKIVITRPMVGAGAEELGILPGGITEKVAPWCIPILDIFKEFYSKYEVEQMLDREQIEIAPLAIMRGRTFKNCLVIADETQNCTPEQMKMLLTRIGEGTRMIITGDMEQHDRPDGNSGLTDIVRRIETRDAADKAIATGMEVNDDGRPSAPRSQRIGLVRLTRADVVRHPVVEDVLDLYDEAA
jgi:phosphate starvation-inducible protein PhoH and related proteins